jgi:DNA polymerase bacteriophage-type
MPELHIDIETYSSIELKTSGIYRYVESLDFEILLIAYAFNGAPIEIIDLAAGERPPSEFISALSDPKVKKHAHNANFERQAFIKYGYDIPISQWRCSMVKAAYCGLPLSLEEASKALNLGDKSKSTAGKALIKYFTMPCRPTKVNGRRTRNSYLDDPEKWESFKEYCKQDVEAERELSKRLRPYTLPDSEKLFYILDQEINDRGIEVDLHMAKAAYDMDNECNEMLSNRMKKLTGVENPNSPAQLKEWLSSALQKEVNTLAKETVDPLIEEVGPGLVSDVLKLRKKLAKSSTKKYLAMLNCTCEDSRARGLFQFYGANRTGRWAGRFIQMHNLPQNHLGDFLAGSREAVRSGDYELVSMLYDDVSSVLSQLIRTAFVAKEGHTFVVADFSAIEARVVAWLAGEQWRLDVFNTHGKIYEASASMMFGVTIEEVTKGSDYRAKGKVAELALGYQGSVGALNKMGAKEMGISESEMKIIVDKWRRANPNIVKFWHMVEAAAHRAIETRKPVKYRNLVFNCDHKVLTIQLPSGRQLFYQRPSFTINKFGQKSIRYMGINQDTKQWSYTDTYGGKLTENITQAIARDILAEALHRLDQNRYDIVMHVHDEAVCEVPAIDAEDSLKKVCEIMAQELDWSEGLPLGADGYVTKFYKKD